MRGLRPEHRYDRWDHVETICGGELLSNLFVAYANLTSNYKSQTMWRNRSSYAAPSTSLSQLKENEKDLTTCVLAVQRISKFQIG